MSEVINVAEHDYATFIISNAMQVDDGVESEHQIVYQVQELLQDDQVEGVTVDDVNFDNTGYQFITTEDENSGRPRYRREISSSSSGYWNEDDVIRLLKVYLKCMKKQPRMRAKPNLVTWNAIFREFDSKKKFTKVQIKTKILRLRNIGRKILKRGEGDRTPWPFWKLVREILEMEDDKSDKLDKTNWTKEDSLKLLDLYLANVQEFAIAGTSTYQRREIWDKMANELGRSFRDVNVHFKQLKLRFERWQDSGKMHAKHPLQPIFDKFHDIAAKILVTEEELNEGDENQEDRVEKYWKKWGREETERVLEAYLELLRETQASKQIKTRRSIYKLVAHRLNFPVEAIQVKLTSMKGHYRKYLSTEASSKWRYTEIMEKIMRLENAIWTQFENITEDLAEPEWFKKYRTDIEKRHNETMTVLEKLLNVMQRILES